MLRLVCFLANSFKHSLALSLALSLTHSICFFVLQSGQQRSITHLQYVAWPDHGVPDDSSDFLDFVQSVRSMRQECVPLMVHCRWGDFQHTGAQMLSGARLTQSQWFFFLQCWHRPDGCFDHHGICPDTDGEGKASVSPRGHYLDERTEGHAGSDIGTTSYTHTHVLTRVSKVTENLSIQQLILIQTYSTIRASFVVSSQLKLQLMPHNERIIQREYKK